MQTTYWIPPLQYGDNTSSDWYDPTNWSNGIPGPNENIVLNPPGYPGAIYSGAFVSDNVILSSPIIGYSRLQGDYLGLYSSSIYATGHVDVNYNIIFIDQKSSVTFGTGLNSISGTSQLVNDGQIVAINKADTEVESQKITNNGGIYVQSSHVLIGTVSPSPSFIYNNGSITSYGAGADVVFGGNVESGNGHLNIDLGGTMEIGATCYQAVKMTDGNDTLIIDKVLLNAISGFAPTDRIIFNGDYTGVKSAIYNPAGFTSVDIASGQIGQGDQFLYLAGNYANAGFATAFASRGPDIGYPHTTVILTHT